MLPATQPGRPRDRRCSTTSPLRTATPLLWATDTGVLSDGALALVAGRAYDAVLLDLTSDHLPDHLDLAGWPEQVAELRRRGAVVDGTRLHAMHLGHGNPPPAELDAVLAGWGAGALQRRGRARPRRRRRRSRPDRPGARARGRAVRQVGVRRAAAGRRAAR